MSAITTKMERAYCLICRNEMLTESGQVCAKCAKGQGRNGRLILSALAAIMLTCGCATPQRAEFDLPATRIICDSARNITADYDALMAQHGESNGSANMGYQHLDTIAVMWSGDTDKDGEPLPDFETLGHEVWHRIKGRWHN